MEKVDLLDVQRQISKLLDKEYVNGKVLLDRMAMVNESCRRAPAYSDPKYAPFYYHLGKFISPRNLLSVNFGLGLLESSFLASCKTVKTILAFRAPSSEYYSPRMGIKNIKLNFKGNIEFYLHNLYDDEFMEKISPIKWDMVIINDEMTYDNHLAHLEFIWPFIAEDGMIVTEYVKRNESASDSFFAFSESVNCTPLFFETRYGTGILQKTLN